jgi:hypothetical protein
VLQHQPVKRLRRPRAGFKSEREKHEEEFDLHGPRQSRLCLPASGQPSTLTSVSWPQLRHVANSRRTPRLHVAERHRFDRLVGPGHCFAALFLAARRRTDGAGGFFLVSIR